MRVLCSVLLATLLGCYHPTAATDVPCATTGDCPSGQTCDTTRTPPLCVTESAPADADLTVIDALPLPIDAAPACSSGCSGDTPFCDLPSNTCRGCIADAECPSDVCTEFDGRCIAETAAIYVTPSGVGNACTRLQPCSLKDAPDLLGMTRSVIKLADGTYTEQLKIDPNTNGVIAIISGTDRAAAGAVVQGTSLRTLDLNGAAIVEGITLSSTGGDAIRSNTELTAYRIAITGAQQSGIDASGIVRLINSTISNASQEAISMGAGGTLDIQRSTINNNAGGGIRTTNVTVVVASTMIVRNGSNSSSLGGVSCSNAGSGSRLSFVTLANNTTPGAFAGVTGGPIAIDNSIVTGNGSEPQLIPGGTASYTLFSGSVPSGPGNFAGLPRFVSVTDFHITSASEARNAANQAATPGPDRDNQSRPLGAGMDVGADEID